MDGSASPWAVVTGVFMAILVFGLLGYSLQRTRTVRFQKQSPIIYPLRPGKMIGEPDPPGESWLQLQSANDLNVRMLLTLRVQGISLEKLLTLTYRLPQGQFVDFRGAILHYLEPSRTRYATLFLLEEPEDTQWVEEKIAAEIQASLVPYLTKLCFELLNYQLVVTEVRISLTA